ncbi:hypothetical protein AMAG_13874 [Allomyces macrogynus ATCC 38327]|uniref:Uncharacterized protein n=1 Tax=Allomyces macrogynus (strain ATCC 38327) TaxID=578462 RepID=A0A0L0T356_ALLM3|nr:hypothetical protein AMAG_13874 [Allomyces macrogynus ATCC 38327]|eukprot:KNE68999.1 hypothetical protein AMAG_13874 [Allomyces macrogynus ATCC 38327]
MARSTRFSPLLAVFVLLALASAACAADTTTVAGTVTSAAGSAATATPAAGTTTTATAGSDKCMSALSTAMTNQCISGVLSDLDKASTANNTDALYAGLKTAVTNVCVDTCRQPVRDAVSGLMSGCQTMIAAQLVQTVSTPGSNMTIPAGSEPLIASVATDLFNFAQDAICLKNPNDKTQLCTVQLLDTLAQYKVLVAVPNINALMMPGSNASTAATLTPSMNATALAAIPKEKLCTPCTQTVVQQTVLYLNQKLAPIAKTMGEQTAAEVAAEADGIIKQANTLCGANWVGKDGTLTLGTNQTSTKTDAKGSGAAQQVVFSGATGAVIGAAAWLAMLV